MSTDEELRLGRIARERIDKIVKICEKGLRTVFSTGLDPNESAHMVMKHVLGIARGGQ